MPTHVLMRTMVYDFLGASTGRISAANMTICMNIAQREICENRDLPFTEEDASLAIVSGTRTTAPPDGTTELLFSRPWLIQYTDPDDSTSWITVLERRYDFILDQYGKDATHSTGDPEFYAIYDDLIYWAPTPSRSITAKMTYHGILKDLSADGDTNDLTTRFWPLLLYKTCAIVSAYMFEGDQVNLYESAYQKELDRVLGEYTHRTYAGGELSQNIEAG